MKKLHLQGAGLPSEIVLKILGHYYASIKQEYQEKLEPLKFPSEGQLLTASEARLFTAQQLIETTTDTVIKPVMKTLGVLGKHFKPYM